MRELEKHFNVSALTYIDSLQERIEYYIMDER